MTIDIDCFYMQQALALAEQAAFHNEVPVGAVVVVDNKVVGRGWNQPIGTHDPTAHAEVNALRDAASHLNNYRLPNATLYVTIEPCTMCAGALVHARIKRLVYGAVEPKAGVVESNGAIFQADYFNHQLEVTAGVLGEECSALMSSFFKLRRQAAKAKNKIQLNTSEN